MGDRRHAAAIRNAPDALAERRLLALHIGFSRLVEAKLVESLLQTRNIALLQQDAREMRAARHGPANGHHLINGDLQPQLPQPRGQAEVPVAARILQQLIHSRSSSEGGFTGK